jgi:hypothetical protein
MKEILGCLGCGFVSRADSLEESPDCSECGAEMRPVSLTEARKNVKARIRNAERRRAVAAAVEIGLQPSPDLSEAA